MPAAAVAAAVAADCIAEEARAPNKGTDEVAATEAEVWVENKVDEAGVAEAVADAIILEVAPAEDANGAGEEEEPKGNEKDFAAPALEKRGTEEAAELAVEAMLPKPKEGWEPELPNEMTGCKVTAEEEVVLVAGDDKKAWRDGAELDELDEERALPNENEDVEDDGNRLEKRVPVVVLDEVAEEDWMKEGKSGVVAAGDNATLPNEEGVVAPEVEASRETDVELATEEATPKVGEGAEAVDDPNPKRGGDEPPPILGFVTEEVAGAADMGDVMFKGKSDPRLVKGEWVVDKEPLKENDEAGPEEKLKVDEGEEDELVTAAAAGVEVELKEYKKGLGADDPANKLLVVAVDELGFDEELKRDDEGLRENAVEEEETPNGLDCEAEVTAEPVMAEPKEKDGVWLAEAAVAEEEEKIGEAAEEKENGEEEDAKELEEREKENPGDWEDDEEEVKEGLKEKDDAIQIRDGLLSALDYFFPSNDGAIGFSEG